LLLRRNGGGKPGWREGGKKSIKEEIN